MSGDGAFELAGFAAVVEEEVREKHDEGDGAEGDDDGGAGGRVEDYAEVAAQRGDERARGPGDGQAPTEGRMR